MLLEGIALAIKLQLVHLENVTKNLSKRWSKNKSKLLFCRNTHLIEAILRQFLRFFLIEGNAFVRVCMSVCWGDAS